MRDFPRCLRCGGAYELAERGNERNRYDARALWVHTCAGKVEHVRREDATIYWGRKYAAVFAAVGDL